MTATVVLPSGKKNEVAVILAYGKRVAPTKLILELLPLLPHGRLLIPVLPHIRVFVAPHTPFRCISVVCNDIARIF